MRVFPILSIAIDLGKRQKYEPIDRHNSPSQKLRCLVLSETHVVGEQRKDVLERLKLLSTVNCQLSIVNWFKILKQTTDLQSPMPNVFNLWYAVEFSNAITNQPQLIEILDRQIVLYRTANGEIRAIANTCIHRGASLALGTVRDDCIVCPYHGWEFQPDGHCRKIPSQPPTASIPRQAKMPTYPVREKYGWIWLYLGAGTPPELPNLDRFPPAIESGLREIQGEFAWDVNYERAIENGLDFAHAPFVHAGAFGNPDAPEVDRLAIETEDLGAIATVYLAANPPKGLWKLLLKGERTPIKTRTGFCLPNLTFLEVSLPFGQLIIQTAHVPIDLHHTVSKWMNFRSFFTGKWADGDATRRTLKIFEQDRPIVVSVQPQVLPIDLSNEIFIPADALQLSYRKLRQQVFSKVSSG